MSDQFQNNLQDAESFYLNQEYEMSTQIYDELINQDPLNPYLHVNAGNSYYNQQNYGKAIYHYLKAKAIEPRNSEASSNLSLALDSIKLKQPSLLSYSWMGFIDALILFALFNLLFLLRSKITHRNNFKFILIVLFGLSFLNLAFVTYEQKLAKNAVVTEINTQAYSGNNDAYTKLFELVNGQIIRIVKQEKNWYEIDYAGNKAWVRANAVEII